MKVFCSFFRSMWKICSKLLVGFVFLFEIFFFVVKLKARPTRNFYVIDKFVNKFHSFLLSFLRFFCLQKLNLEILVFLSSFSHTPPK